MYRVFRRTWWIENPAWPNGLEPGPGKKRYIPHARFDTEEEASDYCKKRNEEAKLTPREKRLSLKYEFEEIK
jgi:hypothetical protein